MVPILDRRQGVTESTWPLDNDIFSLVKSVKRYNMLLAHHGRPLTQRDLSVKFLRLIQHPSFHTTAVTLLTQLDALPDTNTTTWTTTTGDMTSPSLHSMWTIDGLARRLTSTTSGLPTDHCTDIVPRISKAEEVSTITGPATQMTSPHDAPAIQGHQQVHIAYTRSDSRDDPRQRRNKDRREPDPRRFRRARDPNPRSTGPTPRRPRCPKFHGQCHACKRYGHNASTCDQLAMFAYLTDYVARAPPKDVEAAKSQWMARHKALLEREGARSTNPHVVAALYCNEVPDMTMETMMDQLDWDFINDTEDPAYDDEHFPDEE